jgi:hypothetical protein
MDQSAEVSSQILGRQVDPLIHLFQVGPPVRLDQPQDLAGLGRSRWHAVAGHLSRFTSRRRSR